MEKKLSRRYEVMRVDGKSDVDPFYFVLNLHTDEFARKAACYYAELCKDKAPALAEGIRSEVAVQRQGFRCEPSATTSGVVIVRHSGSGGEAQFLLEHGQGPESWEGISNHGRATIYLSFKEAEVAAKRWTEAQKKRRDIK